jgi:hypothetical protein
MNNRVGRECCLMHFPDLVPAAAVLLVTVLFDRLSGPKAPPEVGTGPSSTVNLADAKFRAAISIA